ncbi:MAG: ABC transporter permease [Actinobacteria bacterium]|nr:ABC transporter permease [Actinomycetota bacterium]
MAVSGVSYSFEAGEKLSLRHAAVELWAHRELVLTFAERQLRLRYQQTLLGIAWSVIQPLALMIAFTLTLGNVSELRGSAQSYAAGALAALVPWTFLQSSVAFGSNALVADAGLVRKVFFPRETPILGVVGASAVDLGIGIWLFVVLSPVLGASPSWEWLYVIPLVVPLLLLAAGAACALGVLNAYFRDFRFALPFLLQVWFFATPVVYPLSMIDPEWRTLYVVINPAAGLIEGFRDALSGFSPALMPTAIASAEAIVALIGGFAILKSLEPDLPDVV